MHGGACDACHGATACDQKALRDELLVRFHHGAAGHTERRREHPRGRERVATAQVALSDRRAQSLRELPAQVPRRAVECAEKREAVKTGVSGHEFWSTETWLNWLYTVDQFGQMIGLVRGTR